MPRGVYERKTKDSPPRRRAGRKHLDGYADLLQAMRTEKIKAEDRVVALGTAIETMEGLEP